MLHGSAWFYGFEADVELKKERIGGNKASTLKAPIKSFIRPTVSGFGKRDKLSNVTSMSSGSLKSNYH